MANTIGKNSASINEADEALKQSNQMMKRIIDSLGDGIYALDKDWNFIFINERTAKLSGHRATEMVGKNGWQFFPKLVGTNYEKNVSEAMLKREPRIFEWKGRYSDEVWEIKVLPFEEGVIVTSRDVTNRKKAEEALKENEKRLKRSQEIAHLGSWELNLLTDKLTWSDEVYRIFGLKPQEFGATYEAFLDAVHPDDREKVDNAYSGSLRDNRDTYEVEHRVVRKSTGEIRFVHEKCEHLRDASGKIIASIGMVHDITERKKAEEALAESEQKYRTIIDTAAEGIAITSIEGNHIFVNNRLAQMLGYSADELLRKSSFELMSEEEQKRQIADMRTGLQGNKIQYREYGFRRKDGSVLWAACNASPMFDSDGKHVANIAMFSDITERKKAEEEIVVSGKRYRRLFETSQDGIMARNLEGRMIDCNQAYSRMLGYSKKELTNLSPTDLLPEKWWEQREKVVKEVLETGGSIVFEREYRKRDGAVFPASVRTWRLTDDKGNVIGTWSIVRDITQQKELQEKLQRYATHLEQLVEERTKQLQDSERLAAIGATAGMVGHDIRNPLQAITGDLYLAKTDLSSLSECEEKKNVLESLDSIEESLVYINKIVADLQDFARPLYPHLEEIDIRLLIDKLLRNGFPDDIKTKVEVESAARKVVADSDFVSRIMQNLVNNAVQAMPKGGELVINAYKDTNDIVLSIKDTGVGISETAKAKLFTPMFTTKSKGQGFGLPVVKRMTEALGGTVAFESQEGKGTTFIIRLPSQRNKS